MFGWFKPQCPVDDAAKRWIEERLQWLSEQFGRDVFTRRAVLLPTEDFFPDPVDGTEESVRNLLDQEVGCVESSEHATDVGYQRPTILNSPECVPRDPRTLR